jgi:hypothetical protein
VVGYAAANLGHVDAQALRCAWAVPAFTGMEQRVARLV